MKLYLMTYHLYAYFSHISLIHSLHSCKSAVLKAVRLDLFFPRLRLKGCGLVLYKFVSVAQSCTVCRACCGWHVTCGVSSALLQHACGLEELSEWDRKGYYNTCTTEFWHNLACQQALRGTLMAGREKEGELTNYVSGIWISASKKPMQNADWRRWRKWWRHYPWRVLSRVFQCFRYIRVRFHFALIGGNLTAQLTGSHRGIGGRIQIPETLQVASFPSFSRPAARAPQRACSQARPNSSI